MFVKQTFSHFIFVQVAVLLRAIVGSSIHTGPVHPVRTIKWFLFQFKSNSDRFFDSNRRGVNSNGQRRTQSNECHIITIGHNIIATSTAKLFIVHTTFVATIKRHFFTKRHIIINYYSLSIPNWISRYHWFDLSAEKQTLYSTNLVYCY